MTINRALQAGEGNFIKLFDYPRKIILKLRLLVEGSNAKQKDDTHIAGNAANFRIELS
jgi:hypothetical protein